MTTNKTSTKSKASVVAKKESEADIKPITVPGANLTLFDVNNPVKPIFTDSTSSQEDHEKCTDNLANLALAGMYAAWSIPPRSVGGILSLVKSTTSLIKERCKLYNLPYDSSDSTQQRRRLRTFSID